ncbi:tocopherol cyclase family protein [Serpentinicella alkaliphila]|uniref:Tocopherol cyclase-like protein n=1 Tax=Serpentinicella alkaliphila TaxID=1734049 RepID=A0A4R2TZY7_9FIRM|nr:tocopherol cyclase family protein [Serpentinicella alkaliphila]QUH25282.1 hypothetical protein HZR23_05550 [Serpentinicella alkaliphila]TCQ07095.1 tocopherol cyclase-like protein [Serpentinicella alkaliphila]
MPSLYKLFNPEIFQGNLHKKNYFEGWYIKLISSCHNHVWAIIPGISLDKDGDGHCFIQLINGINNESYYFTYHISKYKYSNDKFEVIIDRNYFSPEYIELNLKNKDIEVNGSLSFENIVKFPKKLFSPGIMGPFSFIPFMECYHGIVNIHHEINGTLKVNSNDVNFSDGYGYIEKNWGKSFPKSWIWIQCNHFVEKPISLMFSIARIPLMSFSFVGFISFLKVNKKFYTFATHTGAKIELLNWENNKIKILLKDFRYKLLVCGELNIGGKLKAPVNGLMTRDIIESISSTVFFRLYSFDGILLEEGFGTNCGMEVCGEITELS